VSRSWPALRRGVLLLGATLELASCARPAAPAPRAAPVKAAARPTRTGVLADGLAAAKAGDFAAATDRFDELLKSEPGNRLALANRAFCAERAGDLARAALAYKAALVVEPHDAELIAGSARMLLVRGGADEAARVVAQGLAREPEDPTLWLTLAAVQRARKNFGAAAEAARRVLLRDQRNVAAWKTLGLVHADEGRLELAQIVFLNALRLSGRDPSVHVNLAVLAHRRGDEALAQSELGLALELDPTFVVALENRGSLALEYRDFALARQSFAAATAAGARSCTTKSGLAFALEGLRESKPALAALGEAYALCKDPELVFTMGTICMVQLRDNSCALEHYEAYAKQRRDLPRDHKVFGLIESLRQLVGKGPSKASVSASPPRADTH